MADSICELVRQRENDHISGTTTISKYVQHSMHEVIETIDAYLNSVHTSGKTDSLDREKPFFNIVVAARNIWFRATDIDRRNIRIKATKQSEVAAAFLATVHLREWMNKARFGQFLNTWGLTLASYGSAVTKFVEIDGVLYPRVIPWNRLIVDSVDFKNNPKIEKLYYTPAQLKRAVKEQGYDKTAVNALIAAHAEAPRKTMDGQQQNNLDGYIEVYEVHGELSRAVYKASKGQDEKDEDEDVFFQQMHVVSFIEKENEDEYEDFTLYSGKEKRDPYRIDHLIPTDGRTLSIGAVEYLFDAQWMRNYTAKAIKDQLDVASKLILQTTDGNFDARNILSEIESGDILTLADGKNLTQVDIQSHDIATLQAYGAEWSAVAQDITATPDALRGDTPPSGTAYRLQQLISNESHSLFELMTENKGLGIEDMMREVVIPYIVETKLNTNEEIAATLEHEDIEQLWSWYVPNEALRRGKQKFMAALLGSKPTDPVPPPPDLQAEQQNVQREVAGQGNRAFFIPSREFKDMTWKEAFKDLEWEVAVEVTNENTDKEAVVTTLSTVLQTIATNPAILQDPNARMVFNKIIEETGALSPVQFTAPSAQPQPTPVPTGTATALQNLGQSQ